MKKYILIFFAFFIVLLQAVPISNYAAKILVRVGYIDIDKIIGQYYLAQQYQDLYETMKKNQYKNLQPLIDKIKREAMNLKYNEVTLTNKELEDRWNNILKLKMQLKMKKNQIDGVLDSEESKFNDEILKNIYSAIKEVSLKYGFNIILEKKQIYFSTPDVDLSDQIIEKLNSDYIQTQETQDSSGKEH
ncbi:OmpH family outer membrane protein [bacterium]|nr:OmpH family outer membrane protein [bacterium]